MKPILNDIMLWHENGILFWRGSIYINSLCLGIASEIGWIWDVNARITFSGVTHSSIVLKMFLKELGQCLALFVLYWEKKLHCVSCKLFISKDFTVAIALTVPISSTEFKTMNGFKLGKAYKLDCKGLEALFFIAHLFMFILCFCQTLIKASDPLMVSPINVSKYHVDFFWFILIFVIYYDDNKNKNCIVLWHENKFICEAFQIFLIPKHVAIWHLIVSIVSCSIN